jgi:hypothetical protein
MTLEEALTAIRTAKSAWDAGSVRNEVAMQAHRGERPRSDWDAVVDAYFEVWGNAKQSTSLDCGPRRGTNWTGD